MRITTVLFLLVAAVYVRAEANVADTAKQVPGRRFKVKPLKYSRKYYEGMLGLLPQKSHQTLRGSTYDSITKAFAKVTPPTSFTWVDKPGVVTSVKNQGGCGSCYAFAGTGAIESMLAIWNNKPPMDLSEKQIVDCSTKYGNFGCNGGLMENVYRYVKAKGQKLETVYPYTGTDGSCRNPAGKLFASGITYAGMPYGNEKALIKVLYTMGPISIGISSNHDSFFGYSGGIYDDPACTSNGEIDHGVLLVGYSVENGTPYWIIKNSWGTEWGENGYMKMLRGAGICKIGGMGSIPVLTSVAKKLTAGVDMRHKHRTN